MSSLPRFDFFSGVFNLEILSPLKQTEIFSKKSWQIDKQTDRENLKSKLATLMSSNSLWLRWFITSPISFGLFTELSYDDQVYRVQDSETTRGSTGGCNGWHRTAAAAAAAAALGTVHTVRRCGRGRQRHREESEAAARRRWLDRHRWSRSTSASQTYVEINNHFNDYYLYSPLKFIVSANYDYWNVKV
jgi:hypothetical protein